MTTPTDNTQDVINTTILAALHNLSRRLGDVEHQGVGHSHSHSQRALPNQPGDIIRRESDPRGHWTRGIDGNWYVAGLNQPIAPDQLPTDWQPVELVSQTHLRRMVDLCRQVRTAVTDDQYYRDVAQAAFDLATDTMITDDLIEQANQ
jgi:hypothetical protein